METNARRTERAGRDAHRCGVRLRETSAELEPRVVENDAVDAAPPLCGACPVYSELVGGSARSVYAVCARAWRAGAVGRRTLHALDDGVGDREDGPPTVCSSPISRYSRRALSRNCPLVDGPPRSIAGIIGARRAPRWRPASAGRCGGPNGAALRGGRRGRAHGRRAGRSGSSGGPGRAGRSVHRCTRGR